jgi:sugar phosphate isomerase/epimerase
MICVGRRGFLQTLATVVAGAGGLWARVLAGPARKAMRLGTIADVGTDPEGAIARIREFGFTTCQVRTGQYSSGLAQRLRRVLEKHDVEATALIELGGGRMVWDFYEGPRTIGLVPRATRRMRIENMKRGSDFAKQADIPALLAHCGFIPEDPNNPLYKETVAAIREVAAYCRKNGQQFLFETGQETPVTLLRTIQDVGLDNLGVNFDTANLILYGKANSVDALELFGKYVLGVHAKDGLYPTNPKELGREVPLGQGQANLPRIIQRLKELNYQGAITIEREITGPQQIEDIKKAKAYLEELIG